MKLFKSKTKHEMFYLCSYISLNDSFALRDEMFQSPVGQTSWPSLQMYKEVLFVRPLNLFQTILQRVFRVPFHFYFF